MRGREGSLFDLGKVVLWVLVEDKFTERPEWVLLVRPNFGQVKNVVTEILGLLRCHRLDEDIPRREMLALDSFEEALNTVLWVLSSELDSRGLVESLEAIDGPNVDLCVHERTVGLVPLESMSGVSMLVVVTVWSSTIREKDHDLVNRLRVLAEIVPEHIGIFQVSLRVTLLGMDEMRELGGITDEEDWGVVEDPVPVSFVSTEFDSEASGITGGIGRSAFTTNRRESDSGLDLLARCVQELIRRDVREAVGNLEVTVSTSTSSMDLNE
jgi:hypothetical protein